MQEPAKRAEALGSNILRDLVVKPSILRRLSDRQSIVVAGADALWRQQIARHLDEMTFERGGMKGRIPIVVAGQEQIGRELFSRNLVELPRLGRGVNRGEPRLAGDDKILVCE